MVQIPGDCKKDRGIGVSVKDGIQECPEARCPSVYPSHDSVKNIEETSDEHENASLEKVEGEYAGREDRNAETKKRNDVRREGDPARYPRQGLVEKVSKLFSEHTGE